VDDGLDMRADLLLGVDLDTTGTRTALFTTAGEVLAEAGRPTPLRWHGPGHVDQDPDDFYRGATAKIVVCLTQAGAHPARVAALGVTGQMAGVLGIDAGWPPTLPYDSWQEDRPIPLDGDGA
jgi:xylulokinase